MVPLCYAYDIALSQCIVMVLSIGIYFNVFYIFRVFHPNSVAVFTGEIGDPMEPKCTKPPNEIEFSEEDKTKVEDLRKWWKQKSGTITGPTGKGSSISEFTLRYSHILLSYSVTFWNDFQGNWREGC